MLRYYPPTLNLRSVNMLGRKLEGEQWRDVVDWNERQRLADLAKAKHYGKNPPKKGALSCSLVYTPRSRMDAQGRQDSSGM